jgi:hypothetical protein
VVPLLVSLKWIVSPWVTRITGPGAVPPKVHRCMNLPSSTSEIDLDPETPALQEAMSLRHTPAVGGWSAAGPSLRPSSRSEAKAISTSPESFRRLGRGLRMILSEGGPRAWVSSSLLDCGRAVRDHLSGSHGVERARSFGPATESICCTRTGLSWRF